MGSVLAVEMTASKTVAGADDRPGRIPKALAISSGTYILALVLSLAMWGSIPSWQVVLFLGGGLAALTFWSGLALDDVWTKYFAFGATFLLACFLNRLLYVGDFLLTGQRFSEMPFFLRDPEQDLLIGEAATVFGTLLTCAVWAGAGGAKYSPGRIFAVERSELIVFLLVTYISSLLATVVLAISAGAALSIGQLLPQTSGLGSVVALVMPRLIANTKSAQLIVATLMSLPFLGHALGTGMKENIILALLPCGFYLWQSASTWIGKSALIGAAVLLLALITAYVGYYRREVWHQDSKASTQEVAGEFADRLITDTGETLFAGVENFLSRSNASVHRGWAVSFVRLRGYQPELVFEPMVYQLVPRVLWPDKPLLDPGGEYQKMVFSGSKSSSLAAGFYTSLYLGGGWTPVLLGAVGIGLLIATLSRFANATGGPIFAGLFAFALVPYALRLDDSWAAGGLIAPIVSFVYILIVYLFGRVVLSFMHGRSNA